MADPQVPDHKRFCSNPDCHDAAGNPTPLECRRQAGHLPPVRPGGYSFLSKRKGAMWLQSSRRRVLPGR